MIDVATTVLSSIWMPLRLELRGRSGIDSPTARVEFPMTNRCTAASSMFLPSKRPVQWLFDYLLEEGMMEPSPWTAHVVVARRFSEASLVTLKTAKNSDAKVLVKRVDTVDTCHTENQGCIPCRGELFSYLPAADNLHKKTKDIQQLQACSCCQRELYWDYLITYPRDAWWSLPLELHLSRGKPWFNSKMGWLEFSMTKGYTIASGVFLLSKSFSVNIWSPTWRRNDGTFLMNQSCFSHQSLYCGETLFWSSACHAEGLPKLMTLTFLIVEWTVSPPCSSS